MLINPFSDDARERMRVIEGTRILEDTLGAVGVSFQDPTNMVRRWTVHSLYAPIRKRALGGIRAKVVDQKNFISFCNQRDLEVLLDIASPGAYCPWLDAEYAEPGSPEWYGLCVDEQDLIDDLYDRELEARAIYAPDGPLPDGLSFERRVHDGLGNDYVETMALLWDYDNETGIGPDTRLSTVTRRWSSIERTPTHRREKLWLCI